MKFVEGSASGVAVMGVGETTQMSIQADGRAFRNLMDGIYSEKEKTVVRELIANGLDSHEAAGCVDREIVVHLPTTFEPHFAVRDFGVGMSHDFVMNHYSWLFRSTKRDDNAQTGMFGVGSKAPLSISDSFTLRCFDAPSECEYGPPLPARTRQYTIYVPAEGVPKISSSFGGWLHDIAPEDARGVEVIVPVARESRAKLLDGLAKQQFFWYDKRIKFEGAFDEVKASTYATISKLADGLFYAPVQRDEYNSATWKVYARQGAAVYPVNESQMLSHIPDSLRTAIKTLCKAHHVLLDFPIGTAEVTVARENISYGENTRKNIAMVFEDAFAKFSQTLIDSVGETRSVPVALHGILKKMSGKEWEAASWAEKKNAASLLGLLQPHITKNWNTWQATLTHEEKEKLPLFAKMPPTKSITLEVGNFPEGKVLLHQGTITDSTETEHNFKIESPKSTLSIKHPHIVYIIPSHLQKWQDRLRAHANETFKDFGGLTIGVAIVRCAKRNVDGVVEVLKQAGIYTSHYELSNLPEIEEDENGKLKNFSKTSVYLFNGGGFDDMKVEPDYQSTAYYLTRIGISQELSMEHLSDKAVARIKRISTSKLVEVIKRCRDLGIIDKTTPIYRVTASQADKIDSNHEKWIYLPDVLFDGAKAVINSAHGILDLRQSGLYTGQCYQTERILRNVFTNKSAGSRVRDVMIALAQADPIVKTMWGFRLAKVDGKDSELLAGDAMLNELVDYLSLQAEIKDDKRTSKINDFTQEFTRRYARLSGFLGNGYSEDLTDNNLKHLELYAAALISAIAPEAHKIPAEAFEMLKPFGDYMDTKIAEITSEVKTDVAA